MKQTRAMVVKPWGGYVVLKKARTYWVKKLFVRRRARLSLQSHKRRSEVWFVLFGTIDAQIGRKVLRAGPGEVLFIPKTRKHRITGISSACVLELAFGIVQESDITRYEDDYGRL